MVLQSNSSTVRERFRRTLSGRSIDRPVYAVYDWFVKNRDIDWQSLFDQGLGQINHVDLVESRRPHLEVVESTRLENGQVRRDVTWRTEAGELHEWYLGEWRQEYFIKTPDDYAILAQALRDSTCRACPERFEESERAVGENGITLGQLGRTPMQEVQIDFAGLETFSLHLAEGCSELFDLLELMNELKLRELREALKTPTRYIKLWENLTIETMGPHCYRKHLVPVYNRLFDVLKGSKKKLLVHYDGKLKLIAADIRALPFDGIDSLTPPPEGDMSVRECRECWPDKFLWLHPNLGWFRLTEPNLLANVRRMVAEATPGRYCLMISEEVPPDWERKVPAVLDMLAGGVTTQVV